MFALVAATAAAMAHKTLKITEATMRSNVAIETRFLETDRKIRTKTLSKRRRRRILPQFKRLLFVLRISQLVFALALLLLLWGETVTSLFVPRAMLSRSFSNIYTIHTESHMPFICSLHTLISEAVSKRRPRTHHRYKCLCEPNANLFDNILQQMYLIHIQLK